MAAQILPEFLEHSAKMVSTGSIVETARKYIIIFRMMIKVTSKSSFNLFICNVLRLKL